MNKEEILNTFLLANIPEIITQEEFNDVKKAIKDLQQQNQKYKEVIDKAIEYINKYESIKAYYEYIDEDGYDEYNYDEDFKKEILDILKEGKK